MKKDKRINQFYTPNIPAPKGHYSQAVIFNDLIFVSGQLPVNPFTGEVTNGSVEEQTQQVLENLATIVKDAGSSKNKILKTTVYISDLSLWGIIDEVYSKFFGNHKPARTVVPVNKLHFGALIEVDAIAAI